MENLPKSESTGQPHPAADRDRLWDNPEELLDRAREYFADDFPNPERQGCPPSGRLAALVSSGASPGDALRVHLFACSECFRDYQKALATNEGVLPVNRVRWWKLLFPSAGYRLALSTAVILLIALSIGGIWLWRKGSTPENHNQAATPLPQSPDPKTAHDPPSQPPELIHPEKPDSQKQRPALLRAAIRIDLDEYPKLREGGEPNEKQIKLPASLTKVQLTLPEGSLAGVYTFMIKNQFGEAQFSKTFSSPNGKSLIVELNLSRLAGDQYRLCIEHKNEPQLCYPLSIQRRH